MVIVQLTVAWKDHDCNAGCPSLQMLDAMYICPVLTMSLERHDSDLPTEDHCWASSLVISSYAKRTMLSTLPHT
jgi:hypothetical protein